MVSESAIDALSIATILLEGSKHWKNFHYLSLGGVSIKKNSHDLPLALSQYLVDHPDISNICLMLDNDEAGRYASQDIMHKLIPKYDVKAVFPKIGKDFNEEIQNRKRSINSRNYPTR